MSKIFKYELRRLLWNKFFIILLLINVAYAWYVLTTDIIAGIAYTAPFSAWSFGAYLGKVMPIAVLTVMFLLTFYYSKKEKQTEILTSATPVNQTHYTLVRSLTLAVCFLIICTVLFSLSVYFYIMFFDYRDFSEFIIPMLIIPIPCFVFALGIGHFTGRIHSGFLYVSMITLTALGFTEISGAFDFFSSGYFSSYPVALPVRIDGEPAFTLSLGFWIARLVYLSIGVLLLAISISYSKRKPRIA